MASFYCRFGCRNEPKHASLEFCSFFPRTCDFLSTSIFSSLSLASSTFIRIQKHVHALYFHAIYSIRQVLDIPDKEGGDGLDTEESGPSRGWRVECVLFRYRCLCPTNDGMSVYDVHGRIAFVCSGAQIRFRRDIVIPCFSTFLLFYSCIGYILKTRKTEAWGGISHHSIASILMNSVFLPHSIASQ